MLYRRVKQMFKRKKKVPEPIYKLEPREEGELMQDKNGNIIKINDTVKDDKGIEWKLINLHGVSMMAQYDRGKRVKTKVLRKVDADKIAKV